MGDPSGIGPEVVLKALASPRVYGLADFLLIGDGRVLDAAARRFGMKMRPDLLDLRNVPPGIFRFGVSDPAFGRASVEYLDSAIRIIAGGAADCLVTGPINKRSILSAGFRGFQGHTEYLAEKTGTDRCAMMFVGRELKITLVTRHIALADVGRAITPAGVLKAIGLTHMYLRKYFGIREPRIGVSGLNPHAGEGGVFGSDEARAIIPAIRTAARTMRSVSGPYPPDVIFHDALKGRFDAVIAMYHDQGLIPFKLLYFKDGVNLTLGLPFVRTSPDHGTAFDIAGKGVADPSSTIEAIRLACRLARR